MRRPAPLVLLTLVSALATAACGRREQGTDLGDAGEVDGSEEASQVFDAPPQPPDDAGLVGDGSTVAVDCPGGTQLIYVASEERELYSFDPVQATFQSIGNIDCANGIYVNSMAVDRSGNAWVNYGDGSLWKSSTQKGGCTSTNFLPGQQGVTLFGMGFSTKSATSTDETLYIDDLGGGGLGMIDLDTMTLMRFGPFPGSLTNRTCELTGTGDGRLFGFFAGSSYDDASAAAVIGLDPDTEAATQQWPLASIDTGSDWAFAFWGGDFYLFSADKYDANDPYTTVTRFRPTDGSLVVVAQNIGFRVVGAGSSTCAPITPAQ
jgi:hypothetical protein